MKRPQCCPGGAVLGALLILSFIHAHAVDPVVSNVRAAQRPGTQLVDITYDLADPDTATLRISVMVSADGGATYDIPAGSFSGAGYGWTVTPGREKRIVWDAGKDWPGKYAAYMRFKVSAWDDAPLMSARVLIPAGTFQMGDSLNDEPTWGEQPVHPVTLNAFYMDRTEVTWALWKEVQSWAVQHGYDLAGAGGGKADNHPVYWVNWFQAVKWCNARSEKEGRIPAYYTNAGKTTATAYRSGDVNVQNDWVNWTSGYRLPTEAEWEYAARGGASGRRFPWGDTITHSRANYYSSWQNGKPFYAYDKNATEGYHSTYTTGGVPYTSPVGSFAPNGFGLFDMVGNVWEWCWDRYDGFFPEPYTPAAESDPRGPDSGRQRLFRGGGWFYTAAHCRLGFRYKFYQDFVNYYDQMSNGFRSVLPPSEEQ